MSYRTFSVQITPALNFINFFHSVRLVALREVCTSGNQDGRSESFFLRLSSTTLSSYCFCVFHPSSLEEIHFSDVRNAPSGIGRRHLVTSRLPSLQFWLVLKIVRAVLALHQRVSVNSRGANQQQVTVPVTLLLFRPSQSPFTSLSSFSVLAPSCHRLAHPRPPLLWQFVMDRQLSD